jgi:hypothetical protein
VMPVAGEDAVLQGAPVQGKAHVGTAIIQGVHPTVVEEQSERVAGDTDRGATGGPHIVQPGGPHEIIRESVHRCNPFPFCTSLYDTNGAESRVFSVFERFAEGLRPVQTAGFG